MGRPVKMRAELEHEGTIVNDQGVECARLTLNNLLIINDQEMYFTILRIASSNGLKRVPVSRLNQEFSLSGGWGFDINVENSLRALHTLKVIDIDMMDSDRIFFVTPLVTPKEALKKIPQYTTRAEILAGLEPIHE